MPSAAEVINKMVAEIGVDDTELNQGIIRVNGAMKKLESGSPTKIPVDIDNRHVGGKLREMRQGFTQLANGAKGDLESVAVGVQSLGRAFDSVKIAGAAAGFAIGWSIGKAIDEMTGASDKIAKALNPNMEDGKRSPQVEAMRKARLAEERRTMIAQAKAIADMGIDPFKKAFSPEELAKIEPKLKALNIPLNGYGLGTKKTTEEENITAQAEKTADAMKAQEEYEKKLYEYNLKRLSISDQIKAIEADIADKKTVQSVEGREQVEQLTEQRKRFQEQISDLEFAMGLEDERKAIQEKRAGLAKVSFGTASSLNREATQRGFDEKGKDLDAQEKALADKEAARKRQEQVRLLGEINDKIGREAVVS